MSKFTRRFTFVFMAAVAFGALTPTAYGQTVVFEKPIRFSLDPAFLQTQTLDEIKQNLTGYVEDINTIFARSTSRRFVFDPDTGVEFFAAPTTGGLCLPITGNYGYLIQVRKSNAITSFGGNGFCNVLNTNELVAGSFNWLRIYSRLEIQDQSIPELQQFDDYYLRQLHAVVHELGHLHGLGSGEYYSIISSDPTGVAPNLTVDPFDPANFFFGSRPLLRTDPMFGVLDPTLPSVQTLRFAPFSARLIDQVASGEIFNTCPSPVIFTSCFDIASHAPQRLVTVQVLDKATQTPIAGCNVQALRFRPNSLGSFLISETASDGTGHASFDVSANLANSNFDILVYFKANCGNDFLAGDIITTFDYQAFLFAPGGGVAGDFEYHGNLILQAEHVVNDTDVTPPVITMLSPLDGGSVAQKSQVAISVNATDDKAVAFVDVFVEGVLLCRSTAAPYGCNWTVPKYNPKQGLQTIRVEATDGSGNMQSAQIAVGVVQNAKQVEKSLTTN